MRGAGGYAIHFIQFNISKEICCITSNVGEIWIDHGSVLPGNCFELK